MTKQPFSNLPPLPKAFTDFREKVSEFVKSGPAAGLEKQAKAAMSAALSKMEVVSKEEFDAQAQILARAQEKLTVLEARIAELEKNTKNR